jgi:putative hydrolase of the HAD superfamily
MTDYPAKIRTLFLDIGGVLLTNGWDRHARKRAIDTFELDADEVNERHHLTFDTYEEGKLSLDQYLDRVIFHEKRSFTRDEFRQFMFSQSQPLAEMMDYIRKLKRAHELKTIAVSNEGRELNEYRIREFHLNQILDAFVSSCFVHFRKPDEDMFRMALDISQTPPDEVVYIDDRAMFVEIAKTFGIHGIVHKNVATTRRELGKFGLTISEQHDDNRMETEV